VPVEALLSGEYATMRRKLIEMGHASLELRPGDPAGGKALLDRDDPRFGPPSKSHDTTTCVAADAAGNFVAATPSGWSGALAGTDGHSGSTPAFRASTTGRTVPIGSFPASVRASR